MKQDMGDVADVIKLREINKWFRSAATIHSQLPYEIHNYGFLTDVGGECARCSHVIDQDEFRGTLTTPFDKGPAVLRGYGLCSSCDTLTPFDYRIRGVNGELVWESILNGVWTQRGASMNWLQRACARLYRALMGKSF